MKNITPPKMNKISSFLIILLFFVISHVSVGQNSPNPPAPPPCPSGGGTVGNGPDGSPLSEGAWLMVGLAFAYGAYEFWKAKKRAKESTE